MEGLKVDVVDWDELEKIIDVFFDFKKILNLKVKINKENNLVGYSFEVVVYLKWKLDEKDEYLIYKMNDRYMNFDEFLYVFKISKLKINIVFSMGDKEYFKLNEYCYIDGKWNCCKDFFIFIFSVYYFVLCK